MLVTNIWCWQEAIARARFGRTPDGYSREEIRVNEYGIDNLTGFRASQPVRAGNNSYGQRQLDACGSVLELAWRWHMEGTHPSGI